MRTITPAEFQSLRDTGQPVILIDVRSPAEFRAAHVAGAINLPLNRLGAASLASHAAPTATLHLICQSGQRSQLACRTLHTLGYTQAVSVAGGTAACAAAGFALNHGQGVMSLERQVRIAAGSLVFVGALLAHFVHPYWLALPAFVGAGLVFAGLSDTCMMGRLIARMPWNH